jgi:type I restriction enzyme, R subunit
MPTEADTCRTLVLPMPYVAGWTDNQIGAGETFAACRSGIATRRADRVNKERAKFFAKFGHEAREILDVPTRNHDSRQRINPVGASISWQRWERQYATDGELDFTLPDVLKVPPLSQRGNVNEIIGKFGGADRLRDAVSQLQTLPYAA